jgi:organic radical activating enzyme
MVQKKNRTQGKYQTKIIKSLENIYISPLESCNLTCKYCYTNKTKDILSNQQILDFVEEYSRFIKKSYSTNLKSILFCGGEVFLLPEFPNLINTLIKKGIFITIITNGTINRLNEIKNPINCQILVSLDGPQKIHDQNRGNGNFKKSIKYIKDAHKLNFPVGIMFLVTKDSYPYKDSFNILDLPKTFLTDRKMSLSNDQCLDIKLHYPTFPVKKFGCFQLSLQSNGNITGCCESSKILGKITDNPKKYISKFINSIFPCFTCSLCQGCCDQSYLCGYPKEFNKTSCQNIAKLFNKVK